MTEAIRLQLSAMAVALALAGCSGASSLPDGTESALPASAAATECEHQLAAKLLSTHRQEAECERDMVLPEQAKRHPRLASLNAAIWQNKIRLYEMVDRGLMSKVEADRRHAIAAENMINNVRSLPIF
jgi:hypothetical protein